MVTGSMFSGKSEELIRRLRRAIIARQRIQVFKPALDDRFAAAQVVSHSRWRLEAERVANATEIQERLDPRTEVVGIDEAQFFDDELVWVCSHLADLGKRVIVAGLDMDFRGEPFGPMPRNMLLDIARNLPEKDVDLSGIGLSTKQIHLWGDQILAATKRGVEAPLVKRGQVERPKDAVVRRLEKLTAWRKKLGEEMKVESDIILPKRFISPLAEIPPKDMDELKLVMQESPFRFEKYGDQSYRLIGG